VSRPQIVVRPGHRIAEHLLVRRQAEREILEQRGVQRGREIRLVDQTAPGRVAGIERRTSGRILLAHRGADAVAPTRISPLGNAAVGEVRDHAALLLDAAQLLAA
jgi:hypothetical protein